MKIIYLHQYFTTPEGPGGTRSYEMARRLVARGHEVHMITSTGTGGRSGWTRTDEAGIQVHWCSVAYSNQMSYRRRMAAFLRFSMRAAQRAVAIGGDVVYATSTPLTIALPAVYASRRLRVPMVFEVRDLWPEVPIAVGALRSRPAIAAAHRLERFAYRHASRVVALSPEMKRGVVATGYRDEQVTVIPNSCDFSLFDVPRGVGADFRGTHDWLQGRPLVVYTGTLGMVNGVDYLARLAAEVRRRDPAIQFLVVGDGREQLRVRQAAQQAGVLGQNFFMMSAIPKVEVPAVLSAADLAFSTVIDRPPLWANSANKVFDTMAAGRAVAINHGGWLAEMIDQTGCGLVLDPHDIPAAAERLVAALGDRSWVARAGAAARRVGRERFDRDRLAGQLESLLREAAFGIQPRWSDQAA